MQLKRSADEMSFERHYRPTEFSRHTGLSLSMVRKLIANRELRHVRAGSAVLIPESAIAEFFKRNRVATREPAIA